MTVARFQRILEKTFEEFPITYKNIAGNRLQLELAPSVLKEVAALLFHEFEARFVTLSCLDEGDIFELIYHLELNRDDFRGILNIRTTTSKLEPRVPSLVPISPAVEYIEHEVMEFFGLDFVGNPRTTNLILPDDWKQGEHPLEKPEPRHFTKNVGAVLGTILAEGASVPGSDKVKAAREKMGLPPLPPLPGEAPENLRGFSQLVAESGIFKQLPSARKKVGKK